jgi:hypothetical protein
MRNNVFEPVCTENFILIDYVTESPNVRAMIAVWSHDSDLAL